MASKSPKPLSMKSSPYTKILGYAPTVDTTKGKKYLKGMANVFYNKVTSMTTYMDKNQIISPKTSPKSQANANAQKFISEG